jgi:hypothetical protein
MFFPIAFMIYMLNPHAFSDSQLYVPEAGNDIPNIIDETLWEIEWWINGNNPIILSN